MLALLASRFKAFANKGLRGHAAFLLDFQLLKVDKTLAAPAQYGPLSSERIG